MKTLKNILEGVLDNVDIAVDKMDQDVTDIYRLQGNYAFLNNLPSKNKKYVKGGINRIYKAYFKLVKCRCFSAPLLISIAMFSAIYIDELFAAAEVALIMTYGGLLEHLTINKAKRGLKRLLQLTPDKARKVFSNNKTKLLSLDKIKKGDILRILPGEIIPADGIIVNGTSSINATRPITKM